MKQQITDIIQVDSSLSVPIYKQIVHSICECIEKGRLLRNDKLPSVNSISETFSLARGSVFTAYNDLRASGIIDSIPGKGYFITSTRVQQKKKVFILFATLNAANTELYNSILNHLGEDCNAHLYFHQHNIKVFEALLKEHAPHYNAFVLVPEMNADMSAILSMLHQKQVLLIDSGYKEFRTTYSGVYRNVEKELNALFTQFSDRVPRYKRLFLVPDGHDDDADLKTAFRKYSRSLDISSEIVRDIKADQVRKGDAFIIFDDCKLANLVKWISEKGFSVANDVGIVSYYDNVLKQVIAGGITTFSTDFTYMGKNIAEMINTGSRKVLENPTVVIDRKSF